jgi:type I restriction-modification system DNA methylase subunit
MGYIFENLVQRFSESYDEDAGAHFTSRDIVIDRVGQVGYLTAR